VNIPVAAAEVEDAFVALQARIGQRTLGYKASRKPSVASPLCPNEPSNRTQNLRLASTGMAARVSSTRSRSRSATSRPGLAPSERSTSPRGEIAAL
jgi:hypothetical protein